MIDEKKIKEAADEYAQNECGYSYNVNKSISFEDGANWAINEFLKGLWHKTSEVPDRVKEILLEQEINGKKQHQAYMFNGASFFREHCRKCGVTRWLYIEDLMKGGE